MSMVTDPAAVPSALPFHPIGEVVALSRMSKSWLYGEIRAGRLRTVMVGHRRMVPDDALADWIAALPAGTPREIAPLQHGRLRPGPRPRARRRSS